MSARPADPLTEPRVPIGHAGRLDARARSRQRRSAFDRHDAFPRRAPMLHARDDLLADKAAFVEIDAVQLVEQRLMREDIAEGIVAAAFRHAEADAEMVVVLLGRGVTTECRRTCALGRQAR